METNEGRCMKIINLLFFSLLFSSSIKALGDDRKPITSNEPKYIPLIDGQESLTAIIHDGKSSYNLREISFSGRIKIDGLRHEGDNQCDHGTTTISLADYKEIQIEQSNYQSKCYTDKEFTKLRLITHTGKAMSGYLIPRNIVVCGKEAETNAEKAWFIKDIDHIFIQTNDNEVEQTNYVNKIFKTKHKDQPNTTLEKTPETEKIKKNSLTALQKQTSSTLATNNLTSMKDSKTITQAFNDSFNSIKELIQAIYHAIRDFFSKHWIK
jgi:hypothetical protein